MTVKDDVALGKEFEKELKDVFKEIEKNFPFFWHQFPDSKTAGKFIAAQPSDFLLSAGGQASLVEAKASVEIPTLADCSKSHIRPAQLGMCTRWHRSGQTYYFIFYCQLDNRVEIWDGRRVVEAISKGVKPCSDYALLAEFDFFKLKQSLCTFLRLV